MLCVPPASPPPRGFVSDADARVCCAQLAGIFLQGSASPYASWVMVGIGLRVAQDVGAHRKKASDAPMTVEGELWKRAFWLGCSMDGRLRLAELFFFYLRRVLVNLDRLGSSSLGRPCAIHDEEWGFFCGLPARHE